MSVGRNKAFKYVKRMLPLFRAVVKDLMKVSRDLREVRILPGGSHTHVSHSVESSEWLPCLYQEMLRYTKTLRDI